jgi:hypothetical protein
MDMALFPPAKARMKPAAPATMILRIKVLFVEQAFKRSLPQ